MVGDGIFCGDLVVFALVMDEKEVLLTSTSELARCGEGYLLETTFLISQHSETFSWRILLRVPPSVSQH